MSALHSVGVMATWAVDGRQAAQLLDALPGSRVVLTQEVADRIELIGNDVIDIRTLVDRADDKWVKTVAELIAGSLPASAVNPHAARPAADLVVDEARWCVRYRGRELRLTDAQYRLLRRLVKSGNRIVPLPELAQDMFASSHSERQRIHAHVKRLRLRLAAETDGRFGIVAVRGLGYRLSDNGEVRVRRVPTARERRAPRR